MRDLAGDCDQVMAAAAMIGGISYFHEFAYDLLAENERILASTFDAAIAAHRDELRAEGFTDVVLLGMGGEIAPFRLSEAAGPGAVQVLQRASGEPLSAPFPGLYTRDGYQKGFKAQASKARQAQSRMKRLEKLAGDIRFARRVLRVAGMGESDLDQLIAPVYEKYENPATTILAANGDLQIHLRARCRCRRWRGRSVSASSNRRSSTSRTSPIIARTG